MTTVIRITFFTIGILLVKETACGPFKKPTEIVPLNVSELPTLPALPSWPYLPPLPALPKIPDLPWLPISLPRELLSSSALPERTNSSTLPALSTMRKWPTLSTMPVLKTKPPVISTIFPSSTTTPKSSTTATLHLKNVTPEKLEPTCYKKRTNRTLPNLCPNSTPRILTTYNGMTIKPEISTKSNETLNSTMPSQTAATPRISTELFYTTVTSDDTSTTVTPPSPTSVTPGTEISRILTHENSTISTLTISTPETSTTSFPATLTPNPITSSFAPTEIPEMSTTVSSTAIISVTPVPETSISSFPVTETPEASTTVTTETSITFPSESPALETSTPSFSVTELPEISTIVTSETSTLPSSSTTTTVTSKDDSTTIQVDPAKLCPADQSFISEKDLETITLLKINDLKLAELLNQTFFAEAVSIKASMKEDLEQFLVWVEDRPAHTKHLLEHLTVVRSTLEQVVTKKSVQLQQYMVLENEYNAKLDRLQKVNNKIEIQKGICKIYCEDVPTQYMADQPLRVSVIHDLPGVGGLKEIPTKNKEGDKYFCSYIDALYHRIENILWQNLNATTDNLLNKMTNDSKMYKEKVEDLKKALKSIALSQFGITMYDILNLQDQYYHFNQLLKTGLDSHINGIKQQLAAFGTPIIDLELRQEKLRKRCSACALHVLGSAPAVNSLIKVDNKETDLVDYVTKKLFNDFTRRFFDDYENIFKELETMFAEWGSVKENIAKLKPIQEEIEKMTAQETEELNKLKESFPLNSIEKMADLERKAKELNEKVNAANEELEKKYNI